MNSAYNTIYGIKLQALYLGQLLAFLVSQTKSAGNDELRLVLW